MDIDVSNIIENGKFLNLESEEYQNQLLAYGIIFVQNILFKENIFKKIKKKKTRLN